ncbi:FecR family protein [Chitinophaga eiseniae]|uniref:DUF4974 domain-containing protein n=1 Tax=Chitinophaga eiseniae TaxID=634771 RepID=A0A847SR30_9BACT|nr:FecR family protein [Chitinophaga eiseniae]NLR80398.1 DUF4974 domain-containing protein [Chitinophaga eiseniae]
MKDPQTWQRYIDKSSPAAERQAILEWLQTQDDAALEAMLDQEWQHDPAPMPSAMAAALDRQLPHLLPARRTWRVLHTRWLVAASVAMLLGALWWLHRPLPQVPVQLASRQIANTSFHVRKLTLPDGSQVWLTPGSELSVPDNYPHTARTLSLRGEAYFEVAPGTTPFRVNAGGIQTTVLGTHFNIEAYPGEDVTNVCLSAGKVAIALSLAHHSDSTLLLSSGTRLSYKKALQRFSTHRFSPERETDWKRGALVLEDIPLEAVFKRLEARYHKKIIATASFKNARFTATYTQESLHNILGNMAFIYGFHYQETGDTVFIH